MIKPKKPNAVRRLVLKALGIPLSLTDPTGWTDLVGGRSQAGVVVTPDKMLQLSAFWACVRLVSETIATLPLNMYEKTSAGKRVATDHPLQMVLHDQPNADTTAAVHWEATIAAMLMRGKAHTEKLVNGQGRLIGLDFLHPDRLSTMRNADGTKRYLYTMDDGRQREIPASRIWMVPGFSIDGKTGVSVVSYATNVVGTAIAAENTAAGVFRSGLKPTRFLKLSTWLTKGQRQDYRDSIDAVKNSLDTGDVPVLEGGMDFGTIGFNPGDAELLQSRSFSVEEICRFLRVDPAMVGHGGKDSNWGTGLEQKMIWFLTFTLGPWLKRMEQAISKDLLTPAERLRYYPKFSVEGLLRSDSAARAAFYSVMVNNGILTRDEVRELEDREPMGGNAAVLTVQTALAPLDSLGTSDDANKLRAALVGFMREPDMPTPG
jgi:HK97 family phage portal protein